jgi:GNAT superfamily N-acetyltransferase
MTDSVVVVRASPDDWTVYRAIRLEALADAPDAFESTHAGALLIAEDGWRERLAGATVFLATAPGSPVGLAAGIVEDGAAELVSMWVRSDARGTGVGDDLVEAVSGWAAGEGFEVLSLWVTEGNHRAERLYARHGFARTGETQPVSAETPQRREFRMSRRLSSAPT